MCHAAQNVDEWKTELWEFDYKRRCLFSFFLSQLKIILICVHLHGTEFLMNLSEYYLLIAYLLFLKIQAMLWDTDLMHFLRFHRCCQPPPRWPSSNNAILKCSSGDLLSPASGANQSLALGMPSLRPLSVHSHADLLHDQFLPRSTSQRGWNIPSQEADLTFWGSIEIAKLCIPEYERVTPPKGKLWLLRAKKSRELGK